MEQTPAIQKIWNEILNRAKEKYDANAFATFFLPVNPLYVDDQKFVVEAPSRFVKEVLLGQFGQTINDYLKIITETDFYLEVKEAAEQNESKILTKPNENLINFHSNLNPQFLFDNFVVGPSNQECYQASLAAALDPGKFYNPLFIYGKSGIGKTHLLHAIGNYCKVNHNKTMNIYYTTANDFVDEFMKSNQNKDVESLKAKFRSIDVLLIDDVQFLAGKDKTGEVFFHIFNNLFNEKKQIVLTSDRYPNELRGLEARLVSRFSSGLIVGMDAPEYETAYAILKRKIEAKNLDINNIDDDVLHYLANNFSSDVRQLEGALTRLYFYATTINKSDRIDINLTLEAFKSIKPKTGNAALTTDQIKKVVAEYYSLTTSQLVSKSRTNVLTIPRHIAIYLCRSLLNMTFEDVGKEFGNRDHTTIMNACLKIENLYNEDQAYKLAINKIKKLLTSK